MRGGVIRGDLCDLRRVAAAPFALLVSLACVSTVFALTDEDVYGALRIPFITPGGRIAAMGGAGLALVDDVAATRLNPARLAAVGAPEALVEGMMASYPTRSTDSGLIQ